jgi:lipopolysaccharide biosynthesis glycosyltransferase
MSSAFVFAADAGYEMPLAVAMSSLVHFTPDISILVLDGGLESEAKQSIERCLGARATVSWLPVDESLLDGTELSGNSRLPATTNYRLILPGLAPEVTRAVYLDADTVVTASLQELLEWDLEGGWLGAVPDSGSPMAAGPAGPDWRRLGLPANASYFNAGVLAIPLDTWRDVDLTETALRVLRELSPRWGDQDALNVAAHEHWVELPRRFNLQLGDVTGNSLNWALWPDEVAAAIADPALVHFNGHIKPWQAGSTHPLTHLWWEALERTPWQGWQVPRQNRYVTLAKKGLGALLRSPR